MQRPFKRKKKERKKESCSCDFILLVDPPSHNHRKDFLATIIMRARAHGGTQTHMDTRAHTHTGSTRWGSLQLSAWASPSFSLAAAPAWREGEREKERESEREIPSSLLSPGSPSCSLDRAVTRATRLPACLPACAPEWRCVDSEMVRSALKWPPKPKRRTGRRRQGRGKRSCAQAAARFHAKVAEESGNSSAVFEEGDGRQRGDGSAWSAAEAPQVRFYSVRNDTKRFSDGCTDMHFTRS